jgi:hypothetical protein
MFPCPNPNCNHTFSSKALQGVSSLVCPKCGTVFQFAPGPAVPARPSNVAKKPSGKTRITPPPLPKTAPPPLPTPPAAPGRVAQEPANFDFHATSELVAPLTRRPASKRRYAGWVAGIVVSAICLCSLVWGGLWLRYFLNVSSSDEEPALGTGFNARFVPPAKPWLRDKEVQQRLHVHIGMKSPEHNNGLALLFKDYKNRMPSDAELLDEAVGKLRSYFKGVEWELPSQDEEMRLAERPAQVCKFQGEDAEQVIMNGECYMMAFRGYGYWFFTWAPLGELEKDSEAIHAEWARLRQRFNLLDGRKGWKEKPRETEGIAGKKAKYYLSFVKGSWTQVATEDDDPHVDFVLKGHEPDPERKPLAANDATVQVLVLPRQPDLKSATTAALDHVKQREMKLYERTTWEPIKDKDGAVDRDAEIGAEHGHLSKLHVKSTEDLERFFTIAVVNRPAGVVVLVGDCLWERRDYWDQEFMALFKSFTTR